MSANVNRCSGSFRTVNTDVAGTEYNREKGVLKIKTPCPVCRKIVGLRSQLRNSRGVLAQHRPLSPFKSAVLHNMDYSAIEQRLVAHAAAGTPLAKSPECGYIRGEVSFEDYLRQASKAEEFGARVSALAIRCGADSMVHDEIHFDSMAKAEKFWTELKKLTEVENFANWQVEARAEAVGRANEFRARAAAGNL